MREQIMQLLREIDEHLAEIAKPGEHLELYLLGRSSLILRLDLPGVSTNDVDIVQMSTSPGLDSLEGRAIEQFGEGTVNAMRIGLYLERVPQGLAPVPHHFRNRCTGLPGQWKVIRPRFLEYHDFAATKLKRFAPRDREDLKLLCDRELITAEELENSLNNAFAFAADEEEDSDRKRAYDAYRKVRHYLETGEPAF